MEYDPEAERDIVMVNADDPEEIIERPYSVATETEHTTVCFKQCGNYALDLPSLSFPDKHSWWMVDNGPAGVKSRYTRQE